MILSKLKWKERQMRNIVLKHRVQTFVKKVTYSNSKLPLPLFHCLQTNSTRNLQDHFLNFQDIQIQK